MDQQTQGFGKWIRGQSISRLESLAREIEEVLAEKRIARARLAAEQTRPLFAGAETEGAAV